MKFVVFGTALAVVLPVWVSPGVARADAAQTLRKTVVNVEAPVAIPFSEPLRDRFGIGTMPAISASLPVGRWTLLGLRLRGGFLSNGPAPADRTIRDPGMGGLAVLSALGRFRPLAGRHGDSRALGPWIEVGVGPGLTGTLVRAVGEAAVGWNFRLGGWIFGPSARYLHVLQTGSALDSADGQLALLGVEIVMHDSHWPVPIAAPAVVVVAEPKVLDRDGDGIPDDADKCPNEPEDKDGFEDEDGCPDPDNDKDGIPDVADKCPNEPETVNGVDDEDGCPDEAPIVVREDRILLTEHVLFDTNRARVRTAGRPALEAVLNLWKQHPEWDHLVVEGHADRRGPDPFNDWLSHERAERARKVIIEMGFPAEKLVVAAFGNKQLRAQGTSEEADRENRRVEFAIVKKVEERAKGADPTQPRKDPDPTQPPAQAQIGRLQP
ncbi:MAG TPA: OmpA family protein [Polyangia bacterium]|jgi:Outer membrane protein and related peptidoglycan-associated (lipo)proteins|nr:OmpA family protein [Polyangia bacterium]